LLTEAWQKMKTGYMRSLPVPISTPWPVEDEA